MHTRLDITYIVSNKVVVKVWINLGLFTKKSNFAHFLESHLWAVYIFSVLLHTNNAFDVPRILLLIYVTQLGFRFYFND